MTLRFLTETTFPKAAARQFSQSSEAKLAVAFWGTDGTKRLRFGKVTAKILCNLESGACNPDEIRLLLNMKSVVVKSNRRLHSKVYWTPNGVFVGSANASCNGLALDAGDTKSRNEGVLFSDNPLLLKQTSKWFDKLWKSRLSVDVDDELIEMCRRKWKQHHTPQLPPDFETDSILTLAIQSPAFLRSVPVFLIIYDEDVDPVFQRLRQNVRDGVSHHGIQNGYNINLKGVEFYQRGSIPAGAWLIDCSLIDRKKPKVHGIWRVPEPNVPLSCKRKTATMAVRQSAVTVEDRRYELTVKDKRLIAQHLELFGKINDEPVLLHISDAARILKGKT